jgi:hypothetical protein
VDKLLDKCKCGGHLMVREGQYQSEEGSTKVVLVQELTCCNKDCDNYNQVVDTITHKMN